MKRFNRAGLVFISVGLIGLGSLPSARAQGNTAPPQASVPIATASSDDKSGPQIHFSTPVYDFGRATSGDKVHYIYYFTNSGAETLTINNVQTSCGCTTPGQYSKQIPAGQTGEIPVEFNSQNYNGPVTKTITVTSNAKNTPSVALQLKGIVWKPIEINPTYAVLNVLPDTDRGSFTVTILNKEETPLQVFEPVVNNPAVVAELQTNKPGQEYHVVLTTRSTPERSFQAIVKLRTSSTKTPELTVTAFVNVMPALSASPAQINLPAGPLTQRTREIVTVINNSTNPITLSEPKINAPFKLLTNAAPNFPRPVVAPGQPAPEAAVTPPTPEEQPSDSEVGISVQEAQPGKLFIATLTFPPGFSANKGQRIEFTMKTSNPKNPDVKIPIMQFGAPVQMANPPPGFRPPVVQPGVPPQFPPPHPMPEITPPPRPPAPNINVPPHASTTQQ